MLIKKEYDIKCMRDCLDEFIGDYSKKNLSFIKIPYKLAYDILDVLNETLNREQNHKTIDSPIFMEAEDVKQTNVMECHNDEIKRVIRPNNKAIRLPSCFGNYYNNSKQCDNDECIHRVECKTKSMEKENE